MGASRRNDAMQRLLKGTGSSRYGWRRRVQGAPACSSSALSRAKRVRARAGSADGARAGRGQFQGSCRSVSGAGQAR